MGDEPQISAIICTHDRADFLARCLDSLAAQTLARERYEIIVVDNASSDATPAIAAAHPARARYVREDRLGLSIARNTGLRAARGQLIAYTDDDARPAPDWLERMIEAFAAPCHPAVVGGEIDPDWGAPPPPWVKGIFIHFLAAGLGWSDTPMRIEPPRWVCEGNCAFRREALERHGPWPEDLGRRGANLMSNENIINLRIMAGGGVIWFDPRVRVRHHIHAERLTKAWMRRRHFWQGVSEAIIARHHPDVPWPPRPIAEFWRPRSSEEWEGLFDDESDDVFRSNCHRWWQLGYRMYMHGMIDGR